MDWKFLWGVILFVLSLAIAKVNTVAFILYYEDAFWRWVNIIIYIITWPMMIIGIYLCGKEGLKYAERFTKYLTYKFYHEAAKEQMRKAARVSLRHGRRILAKRPAQKLRRATKKYLKNSQ